MKLKFKEPYKSITEADKDAIESLELSDLNIITGTNGSGKTHLLESLVAKNIEINYKAEDSFGPIEYFDYKNFGQEDEHFKGK